MSDDKPGWQKQQDDAERDRAIRERAESDKAADRKPESGFQGHTVDHSTYTDTYNKS